MNEQDKREKMGSPLNFDWDEGEDIIDPKTKLEVFNRFMDDNEESLMGEEPLDYSAMSKPDDVTERKLMSLDGTKRRLSNSQLSEGTSVSIARRKKKPRGMPKRPLSAYNLFFQSERTKILEAAQGAGEKIGFEGLGKIIGKKWKELGTAERKAYEDFAEKDTLRYRKEMEAYHEIKTKKMEEEERLASSAPLADPGFDRDATAESSARTYECVNVLFRQVSSGGQSQPFAVASAFPQDHQAISCQEDYAQPHPVMGPPARSPFSLVPQESDLAFGDNNMSPIGFHSQNNGGSVHRVSVAHFAHAPPQGAEQVPVPRSFQMPPGMEVLLSDQSGQDRKYRVEYTCYSMSRDAAWKYIGSLTKGRSGSLPPLTHRHHQEGAYVGGVNQGPQGYVSPQNQPARYSL